MSDLPLQALADAAGLESHYWDIRGHRHDRTPEMARRLLRSLRIPAQSDAEILESLSHLSTRPWRDMIPPAIVAREGGPVNVRVHIEAKMMTRPLRWSITLETGEQITGELLPESLPLVEGRDVDEEALVGLTLTLAPLPRGYHALHVASKQEARAIVIVAPGRCYLPPDAEAKKYWGISAQLYSLRSRGNWGVGDFGDLEKLVTWGASKGAGFIGLNPLHSLFWDAPEDASPYCPSSRLFLNALYLDIEAIADFAECDEARALASLLLRDEIRTARNADLVNYRNVAGAKKTVLRRLSQHFAEHHLSNRDERAESFRRFVERGGESLARHAVFQALSESFASHDWHRWPTAFRDPLSAEVAAFKRSKEEAVQFHLYLQWLCEVQLDRVDARAKQLSMSLGLYKDLAVSVDANSADHWSNQRLFLAEARVGAPPDPFNEKGQEWGVVPFDPSHLRSTGYGDFIALLRANMRHTGMLRIDHVMGWERLFVIPEGTDAREGAYLRFPLHDLLSIAALESHRNSCMLIGEDLGTVRAGFREEMSEAAVLSYKVLYFEKGEDGFTRPADYPRLAVATATTHDLATLQGYWTGEDISLKARLGIIGSVEEENRCREERERNKRQLIDALVNQGLVSPPSSDLPWNDALAAAIHSYLAKSGCMLFAVQLDDLMGEASQVNLPGTAGEYPNWRRRPSRLLEEISADPRVSEALDAVQNYRQGV